MIADDDWPLPPQRPLQLHGPDALGKPTRERFTEPQLSQLKLYADRKKTLQDEVEKMRQRLLELEANVTKTQREYGTIYNAASGLSKLPNEILCMIFRWTQILHSRSSMPLWPLAELTISGVCSRWRALALAYPIMWTFFYYGGGADIELAIERFEAYLERSQSQLLDVWVDFTGFKHPSNLIAADWYHRDPTFVLLAQISNNGHRYRRLSLISDGRVVIDANFHGCPPSHLEYLQYCPGGTPQPETLDEDDDQDTWTIRKWEPQLVVSPSAPLSYVRLDRLSFLRFRPPLNNIVHLRIEQRETTPFFAQDVTVNIAWDAFVEVLQIATLESVSFYGKLVHEPDGPLGPIVTPNLKHFRCGAMFADPVEFIFPYLQAPKLETIMLRQNLFREETTRPPPEEDQFPSLKSIYLIHIHGRPTGWENFVNLTSNAKHLTIVPHFFEHPTIHAAPDALVWMEQNPEKLWAKLETVTYSTRVDRGAVEQWPNKPIVRMPEYKAQVWVEVNGENPQVREISKSGDDVFMPKFWPPDFTWGDNSDDPFIYEPKDDDSSSHDI